MSRRLTRNALALLLGLLLGGVATWASAVDGFGYNGKCFPDSAQALDAYRLSFPYVSNGLVYELTTAELFGLPGQYMYETTWYAGDIAGWQSISGFSSFPVCVMPDDVSTLIPNNFILVCVVVLLWAVGFNAGMKR